MPSYLEQDDSKGAASPHWEASADKQKAINFLWLMARWEHVWRLSTGHHVRRFPTVIEHTVT